MTASHTRTATKSTVLMDVTHVHVTAVPSSAPTTHAVSTRFILL